MSNKSFRHLWMAALSSAFITGLAGQSANAALISIGSFTNLAKGTTTITVPVTISGGEQITSVFLAVAAGDGGPAAGSGVTNIPITAITQPSGSTFTGGSFSSSFVTDPLPAASASSVNIAISDPGVKTPVTGTLVNVTFDITGISQGGVVTLTANLQNFSSVSNAGDVVPTTFTGGSISVVPEPSYMALLATGATMLVAFRRRRA